MNILILRKINMLIYMSIFSIVDIDTVLIQYLSIHDLLCLQKVNKYYYVLLKPFSQELINFNKIKRTVLIPSWIRCNTDLNRAIVINNLLACEYYIKYAPLDSLCESFELCCEYGNVDIIKILISHKVAFDSFGFILACNNGHIDIVKYLYSLDINIIDTFDKCKLLLQITKRNNNHELFEWINSIAVNKSGKTISNFQNII